MAQATEEFEDAEWVDTDLAEFTGVDDFTGEDDLTGVDVPLETVNVTNALSIIYVITQLVTMS